MGEMKSGNIFTVIKNNWRRDPSTATWVENSFQQKEQDKIFQSTYSNFAEKSNSTQQICPESPKRKELTGETMKDISFQYCNEATIHGLRHLSPTTNKIRRFLYFVIVLLHTGFLFNLLIKLSVSYSSNPYRTHYYAKLMKKMDFPSATICNVERMPYNQYYDPDSTVISTLKENIPRSITIKKCSYRSEPCYETEQTVMILQNRMHGCYIVRPAINRTFDAETLQNNYGLTVELTTNRTQKGENGVQVFIHEYKTYPREQGSSYFAGPRDTTVAVIQPQKVVTLGTPYHDPDDDCWDNESPTQKNPLKFYDFYSQTNCQRECSSLYVKEHCNCTMAFYPGDARQCTFRDYFKCVLKRIRMSKSPEIYTKRCKCKRNCSSMHYESRISTAGMRYSRYSKQDIIHIKIYFENMVMKVLKERPRYELDELLASFGGQMGLFLGASVISIYEILEMVLMFFWGLLTSIFRKAAVRKKNTEA